MLSHDSVRVSRAGVPGSRKKSWMCGSEMFSWSAGGAGGGKAAVMAGGLGGTGGRAAARGLTGMARAEMLSAVGLRRGGLAGRRTKR